MRFDVTPGSLHQSVEIPVPLTAKTSPIAAEREGVETVRSGIECLGALRHTHQRGLPRDGGADADHRRVRLSEPAGSKLEAALASERIELAHLSRRSQLGELSGAFAHELTQPLTSILANAEAGQKLSTEPASDMNEIRAIFDDIVADDRRASSVISHLRSMMLKGEASQEILDLNEAVRQTVALARAEMVARRTEVEVHDELASVRVKGNLVQLQQVILNLLVNAADAMADLPPRQRRVEIAVHKGKNGYCELSVADMGPGIPAEMQSEVFKPFVSPTKGGLGLGLAICRSIVEAQGGKLFFDDGVKPGARAVVILPSA
nr:ATP-binding protein [Sinorhizobium meliloti]